MFSHLLFTVLCASSLAVPISYYSFSPAVGGTTSGDSFSTAGGDGRITAIKVWEAGSSSYISGIQVRYGYIWSARIGREVGTTHKLELYDGESIVQVSGKYHTNYIYQLIFVTSRGRSLIVGYPNYRSFNFYPTHQEAELKLLSGRVNTAGIISIAAHWGVYMDQDNSTDTS